MAHWERKSLWQETCTELQEACLHARTTHAALHGKIGKAMVLEAKGSREAPPGAGGRSLSPPVPPPRSTPRRTLHGSTFFHQEEMLSTNSGMLLARQKVHIPSRTLHCQIQSFKKSEAREVYCKCLMPETWDDIVICIWSLWLVFSFEVHVLVSRKLQEGKNSGYVKSACKLQILFTVCVCSFLFPTIVPFYCKYCSQCVSVPSCFLLLYTLQTLFTMCAYMFLLVS